MADGIVGKKAHGAGSKGRQARQARGLVAGKRTAENGKYVVFKPDDFFAFRDGDLASARNDALEWGEADEGVAAYLFAAFDGLEEKALALLPSGAEEGRYRGFEVGGEGAADRHQSVFFGERQKFFAGRLDGMAGSFHRVQCNCWDVTSAAYRWGSMGFPVQDREALGNPDREGLSGLVQAGLTHRWG